MNAVLDLTPDLAQLLLAELMERAQALQAAGRSDAAAALYGQWIDRSKGPLKQVACFNQGTLLSSLQRDAEGGIAYEAALAHEADFPPALLNLGHLLERRGQRDDALLRWARVIEVTAPPKLNATNRVLRLHALNNSARLLESMKRLPEAMALMQQSLRLGSRSIRATDQ